MAANASRGQEVLATAPPIVLRPSITVQETYTDNADLTSSNRSADYVTRGMLSLDADVNTGRTTATLHGDFAYDRYARQVALSGWSLSANGTGNYSVVPQRLDILVRGTVTDGFVSTFNTSVTDRSGVANRIQLATYDIGPRLNMDLGDVGDLAAALRFAQVFYSAADASTVSALPNDDNILQLIGRLDTGTRYAGYQSLTTVEADGDNQGYRSANGIESLYFSVTPDIRVFGRAGYETVFQPGITRINSEILSAGFEITPNERSRFTVEGGRRYDRLIWNAKAKLQLSPRILLTGQYSENVQPDQVYVADTLGDFIERTAALPPPVVPGSFRFSPNLYNQVSLNKTAEVHVIYSGQIQSLDASVHWADRNFLSAGGHDRTLIAAVAYTRKLRPLLSLTLAGNYARTFDSPVFGASETYFSSAGLTYQASRFTDININYGASFARQFQAGGAKVQEHVVAIALRRRFF
jgi:hypothetical protein